MRRSVSATECVRLLMFLSEADYVNRKAGFRADASAPSESPQRFALVFKWSSGCCKYWVLR